MQRGNVAFIEVLPKNTDTNKMAFGLAFSSIPVDGSVVGTLPLQKPDEGVIYVTLGIYAYDPRWETFMPEGKYPINSVAITNSVTEIRVRKIAVEHIEHHMLSESI